ncbi:MAG: hypothetical protein H8E35_02340 [Ardenticatenia bacterium]|nr:hypothetical protein [Ardenticatenia bacterium]
MYKKKLLLAIVAGALLAMLLAGMMTTARPARADTYTTTAGVRVEGAGATGNTITENSIHDNSGLGIELANNGNAALVIPGITQASCYQVQGSACAGCRVQIFSDLGDQGRMYEATTTANSIQPAFAWSGRLTGPHVTITATDSQGNTSQFSLAFNVGLCPRLFLPLVLKNSP